MWVSDGLAGRRPATLNGWAASPTPPNIIQSSTTPNNTQPPLDFSKIMKPAVMNSVRHAKPSTVEPITFRRPAIINGYPVVKFTKAEVERMNY